MLLGLYQARFGGSQMDAVFFSPAPEIQDFCTRNNLEGVICTGFRTGLARNHFPACSSCGLLRARHGLAAQLDSVLLSELGKMENIPLQAQSDLSQLPSLPAAFHVATDHPSKAVLRQTRTPACGGPGSAAAWNKSLRSAPGLARHARLLQSRCWIPRLGREAKSTQTGWLGALQPAARDHVQLRSTAKWELWATLLHLHSSGRPHQPPQVLLCTYRPSCAPAEEGLWPVADVTLCWKWR